MVSRSLSRAALLGAVLTVSIAVGACTPGSPTPVPTPPPTATPTATATATPTPTPKPTATATATPAPTASPSPTPSPTPAPTVPSSASVCTGSDNVKTWFGQQAPQFSYPIYCAALPAGWGVLTVTSYPSLGIEGHYQNSSGNTVDLWEGTPSGICHMNTTPCTGYYAPDLGNQAFGGLTGDLAGGSGMWEIIVDTASARYVLHGKGMTESQFRAMCAAMHKVA